jgi:hypothetical protein
MTSSEWDALTGYFDAVEAKFARLHAELVELRSTPAARGEPGEAGPRGPRGERGIDGRDGRDGKDGIASRDELRAEVERTVAERLAVEVERAVDAAAAARPQVEYRGVYREGAEYVAGNFVTWAGSVWHCNTPTTQRPGDVPAWTLAVKKGRDAK